MNRKSRFVLSAPVRCAINTIKTSPATNAQNPIVKLVRTEIIVSWFIRGQFAVWILYCETNSTDSKMELISHKFLWTKKKRNEKCGTHDPQKTSTTFNCDLSACKYESIFCPGIPSRYWIFSSFFCSQNNPFATTQIYTQLSLMFENRKRTQLRSKRQLNYILKKDFFGQRINVDMVPNNGQNSPKMGFSYGYG